MILLTKLFHFSGAIASSPLPIGTHEITRRVTLVVTRVFVVLTRDIFRLVARVTSLLLGELQPLVDDVDPRPCVDTCALALHSMTTKSLQCL